MADSWVVMSLFRHVGDFYTRLIHCDALSTFLLDYVEELFADLAASKDFDEVRQSNSKISLFFLFETAWVQSIQYLSCKVGIGGQAKCHQRLYYFICLENTGAIVIPRDEEVLSEFNVPAIIHLICVFVLSCALLLVHPGRCLDAF